jgi:hypothetical protein
MSEPAKPTPYALVAALVLGGLTLVLWISLLATLSDLTGSDAAGNGLAQAFAAIEIVPVWVLLAVVALIAGVKGDIGPAPAIAAAILIPASCIVTFFVLGLLTRPSLSPFLWPLVIPAAVPPLVLAFCCWALIPPLRKMIRACVAAGFAWGLVLLLCLAIVPFEHMRERAKAEIAAAAEKYATDLAKLPPDAPLWDWVPFLNTRSAILQDEILDRIRKLERRQSDAEAMLARGDFPLGFLGRMDLKPTPAVCEKTRALLLRKVEPLVLKTPNAKPYAEIAQPVSDALSAMNWLVGLNCPCDAEALAWETMAKAYTDTNYDVYELRDLRDPKRLGWLLRQQSEQSH